MHRRRYDLVCDSCLMASSPSAADYATVCLNAIAAGWVRYAPAAETPDEPLRDKCPACPLPAGARLLPKLWNAERYEANRQRERERRDRI